MRHRLTLMILGSMLALSGAAPIEEHPASTRQSAARPLEHSAAPHAAESEAVPPHPIISEDGSWGGALVIGILLGLFLPAAVIGPTVHAFRSEEVPPAHSHDEPPGASHHHGPGGTFTQEPH